MPGRFLLFPCSKHYFPVQWSKGPWACSRKVKGRVVSSSLALCLSVCTTSCLQRLRDPTGESLAVNQGARISSKCSGNFLLHKENSHPRVSRCLLPLANRFRERCSLSEESESPEWAWHPSQVGESTSNIHLGVSCVTLFSRGQYCPLYLRLFRLLHTVSNFIFWSFCGKFLKLTFKTLEVGVS